MKDPDALLDRPPAVAIRTIALALVDEASAGASRLSDEADLEALHDFRVGLRRLRSLLKAYWDRVADSISPKQARALRDLARSTGGARDSEVQLEWIASRQEGLPPAANAAAQWLKARLEERVRDEYLIVRTGALGRFEKLERKFRAGLGHYEAALVPDGDRTTFALLAGETIRAASGELSATLIAIKGPFDVEGAHETRIRSKRLRYLLEPLKKTSLEREVNALVATIKGLQERLGSLHDVHVLLEEVSSALVESTTERSLKPGPGQAEMGLDPRQGLLVIEALVRESVEAIHQALCAEWLGEPLLSFSNAVEALCVALCKRGTQDLEIERKYLLTELPAITVAPLQITQGWIPGTRLKERLRRVGDAALARYYRTVKVGKGLQRIELEEETTREVFEQLWSLTEGHRVEKRRFRVPEGDRVWELDQFLDRDLVVAEIELGGPDEKVVLPEWLKPHVVREVTGEDAYSNEKLAR